MIFTIGEIHRGTRYRIKDREKAVIFQEICTGENVTRKSISHKLKIRPTTVSRLVQELLDEQLVVEGGRRRVEKPGRPEFFLLPNKNRLTAISIYVEGRKLKGQIVNLHEEILHEDEITVGESVENEEFTELFSRFLINIKSKIPPQSILTGAGVSLVGTVNSKENLWISCARWNRINNLNFAKIEEVTGVTITIKRALDTELKYRIVKNRDYRHKNILLFHWGFGIGASFAHRGEVLSSTIGRFGEIGHSRIFESDSKPCRCGLTGCLETEAAIWAIVPPLKAEYPNLSDDEREFTVFLQLPEVLKNNIIANALRHVSAAITILYKIFYPDEILLIGPFAENRLIINRLRDSISSNIPTYARSSLKISVIYGGFKGSIYGNTYDLFFNELRKLLIVKS